MSTANEEMITANGVDLAVETFGERSQPAILLIHGAGNSMLSWADEFCERLAAGGRFVVRYDSRDHGRSTAFEAGAPPYELRDLVADAAGVLDGLGLDRVHVVGRSQGAATASRSSGPGTSTRRGPLARPLASHGRRRPWPHARPS